MTQTLIKTIADFSTTLTTKTAVGATTGTLTTGVDSDSVQLPTATYAFTIDRNNSQKEHFTATLTGAALTSIETVTRGTGLGTSGLLRTHRKGAEVVISDHAAIKRMMNVLDGTDDLDSATVLKYDAAITQAAGSNELASVAYVDGVAIAGAADATVTTKGIVEEATQAEIDADTAAGATSARLFVNPSTLRTSEYGTFLPTTDEKDALAGTGTPNTTNKYITSDDTTDRWTPSGVISPYSGFTAPTGWLLADGTAVSRTTYSDLFAVLTSTLGTFTITIAAPGVVTLTSHGLATGDAIYITTTGAIPTGLSVNTRYWITKVDANSFKLATSLANALASTNITTTGTQSGVHTAVRCPHGVGDGSTTFNLPNLSGVAPVGLDTAQTEFAGVGQTGGAKTHTLVTSEMPAHTHTGTVGAAGSGNHTTVSTNLDDGVTGSTGGDGAHNNLQPYTTLNYIIKT